MELHNFGAMEECVFVIMATSMHLYGRLISSAIRTRNLIASSVGRQATAEVVTWSVRGLGGVHVTPIGTIVTAVTAHFDPVY